MLMSAWEERRRNQGPLKHLIIFLYRRSCSNRHWAAEVKQDVYNQINYIRQHCLFLLIHKATCFDPSVGHWCCVHFGIQMCIQHQWHSLLCRPVRDWLMGRNMQRYVLIKYICNSNSTLIYICNKLSLRVYCCCCRCILHLQQYSRRLNFFIEWSLISCKCVPACTWRESDVRNRTEIMSIDLFQIAFEIFSLHNGMK